MKGSGIYERCGRRYFFPALIAFRPTRLDPKRRHVRDFIAYHAGGGLGFLPVVRAAVSRVEAQI
jgi:hypothetical protein